MRPICRLILCLSMVLLGAREAGAQARLHGRVLDDATDHPIAGATVTLQDPRGRRLAQRVTDEAGGFSFSLERGASVRVGAAHLGYRPSASPSLEVGGDEWVSVEIRLAVAAVLLAPLEVVVRSRAGASPTLSGFQARRESNLGWFLTREEIERRRPHRVSDLLVLAPGMRVERRIIYTMRGRACPAQIFIDGFHINRPMPGGRRSTTEMFPIDDLLSPGAVEGIEVYQGVSNLPPEFRTQQAGCGVVAIWTRRGDR